MKNNPKVIVFCNEFFGAWNTARGGYGFIARHLLPPALGVPLSDITVCVGRSRNWLKTEEYFSDEGIKLIKLPKWRFLAAKIVNTFDVIISIEASVDYLFSLKDRLQKPVLFWVQDPRPARDWEEINTVSLAKEPSYWNPKTYTMVKDCYDLNLVKFATQAHFLTEKAIELYNLPKDLSIPFLPNPLPIDSSVSVNKSNNIIYLGRLDSVKRGWLFCEIAKRMPQYQFFVLGASTNSVESKKNSILNQYSHLPNLHFLGHLDGEEKAEQLRKAKILVNTSIHEALPVSFLEAFAYEVSVVSNQNPDNLVERFGKYVGTSLGDGWEDVDKFVESITYLMEHESERQSMAQKAKDYVQTTHSYENFRQIFNQLTNSSF